MTPLRELVDACLDNKPAAQKALYDLYAAQMMGVCYRYTRQMEEARDVLQDGFVKVFKNLHQWTGEGELGGWIRRIMVNTALNRLRDRKHLQWQDESAIPDDFETNSVPTPASHLDARQLADLIRQLPVGYQTVFNLHAVEGYSHVEIARLLGISEGTSRSQYLRARRLLMEKINQLDALKTDSHVGRA